MLRVINWVMQAVSTAAVLWFVWHVSRTDRPAMDAAVVMALVLLSFVTQFLVFRQKRDQDAKAAELPPGRLQ